MNKELPGPDYFQRRTLETLRQDFGPRMVTLYDQFGRPI